jgi:DNA excision repair protein ERCC-3
MMGYNPANPLIVQGTMQVMLEVQTPLYTEARDFLARFAELKECPEYMHTYEVTELGLWNAFSAGMTAEEICDGLARLAKYPVPPNVFLKVREQAERFGALRLEREDGQLVLNARDRNTLTQLSKFAAIKKLLKKMLSPTKALVDDARRGELKHALIRVGYPVQDLAGYTDGDALEMELRTTRRNGKPFGLRAYQGDAVDIFYQAGGVRGGSGVLVLPCGAGKTVIGIASMVRVGQKTLILTTNITALRQWRDEILDKTTLTEDQVGEYSGEVKEIKPVTLTTYQLLTFRKGRGEEFTHMKVFNAENWGLIIYDEVHMLPAPVFREVANIQARRRLGLTATLVREDELEEDVFSLIGPKKFDMPWKTLESQGWIAKANCVEVRVPVPRAMKDAHSKAEMREAFRMASVNPFKILMIRRLVEKHADDNILVIGQYLDQLEIISQEFNAPIITGKTPNREREAIYAAFKKKEYKMIIVSKVANFAIDLPDANVAIQVSGTFGSRQEEAQRLGRVLRPKGEGLENVAWFYSLTTRGAVNTDQPFAEKRQRFLTGQGYEFRIDFPDFNDADEAEATRLWNMLVALRPEKVEEDDEDPLATTPATG